MTALTVALFAKLCGATLTRASSRYAAYVHAMAFYGIDKTPQRVAMFLANIGHESGGLQWSRELWGPTSQQKRYERSFFDPWPATRPEADLPRFAVNRLAYMLGNDQEGDGYGFRGGGEIQTTGRTNFRLVTRRLRQLHPDLGVPDFEAKPELIAEPRWSALSSCDYADRAGLNAEADTGNFDHYCDRINFGRETAREGDSNGYADRVIRLHANYALLGLQ